MKKSKNPNAIPTTSSIYRWQPLCRHHFPSNQQIRKVAALTFIAWSCTKKSSMTDGRSLLQRFNDTAPLKNWKLIDEITQSRMYSNFHCSSASASQHRSTRKKKSPPKLHPALQEWSLLPYPPTPPFSDRPFCFTNDQSLRFIFIAYPPPVPASADGSKRTGAAKQMCHLSLRCVIFLSSCFFLSVKKSNRSFVRFI